jgi:hypothetical protein
MSVDLTDEGVLGQGTVLDRVDRSGNAVSTAPHPSAYRPLGLPPTRQVQLHAPDHAGDPSVRSVASRLGRVARIAH